MHTKEHNLPLARLCDETYGDAWVWVAFAPMWRLVLAFVPGKRTQDSADLLLRRVLHVTDEHIPFFTSDQLLEYRSALLTAYGIWHQPLRKGTRGRYPNPLLIAPPELLYAQVVKVREHGRVVEVDSKVVADPERIGRDPWVIAEKLASFPTSETINTSFVERNNLTQRQSNRRRSAERSRRSLTRRTNGFSKDLSWFEKQRNRFTTQMASRHPGDGGGPYRPHLEHPGVARLSGPSTVP